VRKDGVERRTAVVHVVTQLELGGAQRNTLYTASHLDKERFLGSVVAGPGGVLDQEARELGVPVLFCPSLARPVNPVRDWAAVGEVKAAIRQLWRKTQGRLVVHTHSSKAGVVGRWAARQLGAKVVVHTVHGFAFHDGQGWLGRQAYQVVERVAAPFTDAMVFVSRRDALTAERLKLVPRDGGHVIRSGIDLRGFHPDPGARAAVRAELGVGQEVPLLVTVANFKPQKDPLTGVRAFARVVRARPEAHWLFVGDGEGRAALEAQVAAAGLGSRVHLPGWRQDVPAVLAAADLFMLCSRHEGLPRSVVEALATGVPVAATDAGGTREVVVEGTGRVVPVGDAEALGEAVLALLAQPPPVAQVAPPLLKEFDIDQMVRRQEDLYEWLLAA
jgi:glycosyltransferase involved in cell wall biosynthesis